jgi:hypothetical protein
MNMPTRSSSTAIMLVMRLFPSTQEQPTMAAHPGLFGLQ